MLADGAGDVCGEGDGAGVTPEAPAPPFGTGQCPPGPPKAVAREQLGGGGRKIVGAENLGGHRKRGATTAMGLCPGAPGGGTDASRGAHCSSHPVGPCPAASVSRYPP